TVTQVGNGHSVGIAQSGSSNKISITQR
ncbi:MAG: curlin repeat-containing protein, partial [Bosea sp. (in: a-proteobacteria)]